MKTKIAVTVTKYDSGLKLIPQMQMCVENTTVFVGHTIIT